MSLLFIYVCMRTVAGFHIPCIIIIVIMINKKNINNNKMNIQSIIVIINSSSSLNFELVSYAYQIRPLQSYTLLSLCKLKPIL